MEKERLLIYAHYYYPDVASTGQLITELAEGLIDEFDVTVICVVPSYTGKIEEKYKQKRVYKETINGVRVLRVRVPEFSKENKKSRLLNISAYLMRATLVSLKLPTQDYIMSVSQPPVLGGLLGVFGKWIKRGKFIYTIQDFNPEQTSAVSYSKSPFLLKSAMLLDKFSCRQADQIIVVGRDMQETLTKRFSSKRVPQSIMINNWTNETEIYPLEPNHPRVRAFKSRYNLEDKFIIQYSGNLGLYYDLENLLKVISHFRDRSDIAFVFIGEGTVKTKLMQYKEAEALSNVEFIPYQDKKDLIYSLNAGDVHWVVNAKGIKGISVPSKLYGVMAAGKPVVGVLEEGSEARCLIEESGCGLVADPMNYKQIEEMILHALTQKNKLKEKGLTGRKYLEQHLTKEESIRKYATTIRSLKQPVVVTEKG